MYFDGTEYTIVRGEVRHAVPGGSISECNLPTSMHGGAVNLGTRGDSLIVTCADGTQYNKRHGCGWTKCY